MSMAAGEYVSVSSQSDIERADIVRERHALAEEPEKEHAELVAIYQNRGLSETTAKLVADELTRHDALATHVRDELGLSEMNAANPLQAALASGATFSIAGSVPLVAAALSPASHIIAAVLFVTVLALAGLGVFGAKTGGAPVGPSLARVVGWGLVAMLVTAGIGKLFGVNV
jgi:VIT1/CCC1 family predicted Fe2+/Mn2+ transporter